jgi:hypothetical protein
MVFTVPGSPRTYNAGTSEFGPFSVPNGATLAQLRLSRDSWPVVGGNLVHLQMDWRQNNQGAWFHLMSFTAEGGVILDRLGAPILVSKIGDLVSNIRLPEPENNQRQVRIVLTAAATFQSTVEAEVI